MHLGISFLVLAVHQVPAVHLPGLEPGDAVNNNNNNAAEALTVGC